MKNVLRSDFLFVAVVVIGLLGYQWYKAPKYHKGEVAPDFTSVTPSGEQMSLSDFKGKYVLLDFWGDVCFFGDVGALIDEYRTKK